MSDLIDVGRIEWRDKKRRCPAMIVEGIEEPESQQGIDFCVKKCPYSYCVALEEGGVRMLIYEERVRIAKGLRKRGVEVDDIAAILECERRIVWRYLRRKES